MTGSEKSLAKGSPAPGPVSEETIRVYSMRFCPYAQRARLVLAAKGIKHEVININLKNKPDWFIEKSPFGLVPSLETSSGQVIYESPIVCDYLDEVYPGKKLTPADPFQKAQQKMIVEHFSKISTLFYKILLAKKNNEDVSGVKAEVQEKLVKLDEILAKQNGLFFGGSDVSMVDYMIWPWFERLIIFDSKDCLNKTPHIDKWYQQMLQDPAVKATYIEPDLLLGFFKLYSQNDVEACDYGL
uniref:Glutathione S-transferase omega n=1 Tax=Xenopus tropicalis TaxID=8364 RepID=Q28I27_XENTR|nr:Novel glutathione S-transferase omega protein [Xenopus tropicalis]|eukprot:XP_012821898.1 PREDICTED: glutathione S-transferase omega 2 isoform X1 [Xenopus tropicalis]